MKRITAIKVLNGARAIECARDAQESIALMREAGASESDVARAELEQFHASGRDRARSIIGGGL